MSVLMHLCRTCRHRATSHQGGDRGYSGCRCCRGPGDLDPEPVLVATFTMPGGAREPLHPPGSLWNAGTTHQLRLCDCPACRRASG
ncbi:MULTISPECIES: hypothetical protein [unclassified Serinicoccus]|uniref:hypothetical protein n=1 Tax=unclassified Serinicoccus TaxID=2643101 RepID=UPI003853D9EC